jgi:hypothetical protein
VTLTATRPAATSPSSAIRRWCSVAAVGAAGAGVLHVAAAVEHREAGQLVVGLFLVATLAQVGGAWLLAVSALQARRPGAGAVTAALAGTLALVVLYVVAHTTDLLAGLIAHDAGTTHDGGHGAGHGAGASIATEGAVALDDRSTAGGEAPGLLATATVALELLCALGLTALLPRTWRGWALDAMLALGALGWALWLTGVLG